jgi:hypothetical protein
VCVCLTRKSLLDIDHFPCTRLHEATAPLPRPLQPLGGLDDPPGRQIALVARNKLHWRHFALVYSVLLFHVDHLGKVFEAVEAVLVRDIVDEEEGIGPQVRGGPERAVLLLARRVGEHEEVGLAIDGARHRVRVFCAGVNGAVARRAAGRATGRTWHALRGGMAGAVRQTYLWSDRSCCASSARRVWNGTARARSSLTHASTRSSPAAA